MEIANVLRRLLAPAVLAVGALVGGCAVEAQPAYVATEAPVDVYAYPHVWYNGAYVYYVNDRWYYPTAGGWGYYREEPYGLHRWGTYYRSPEYVHAHPAYGGGYHPGYGGGYHPGYGGVQHAPPAHVGGGPGHGGGYHAPPAHHH